MADYNINLRIVDGTQKSPTKPKTSENKPTSTKSSSVSSSFKQIINSMMSPDALISQGLGAVSKAVPVIAGAMAVIKVGDKVYQNLMKVHTIQSGNFTSQINYNNFKSTLNAMIHPFSTALNRMYYNMEIQNQNERLELNRSLLGDTILNGKDGGYNV